MFKGEEGVNGSNEWRRGNGTDFGAHTCACAGEQAPRQPAWCLIRS